MVHFVLDFVLERLVFVLKNLDFHTCLKRKISKWWALQGESPVSFIYDENYILEPIYDLRYMRLSGKLSLNKANHQLIILPEHLCVPFVSSGCILTNFLFFCVMFCRTICPLHFSHCIVCPSSVCGIWLLHFWYFQTFSTNKEHWQLQDSARGTDSKASARGTDS